MPQDEARVGQQTKLTRRWAKRGTRPSAPKDQRRSSAWLFCAICPAEGKAAGIVIPRCNSEAMSMHLKEIAFHVAPEAHGVLLLDQAVWQGSAELVVLPNITLMPLPPRCPELNPAVHARQLAVEPHLPILRRYRRLPLLRLDQARRATLAHHVPRLTAMGPWVLINAH